MRFVQRGFSWWVSEYPTQAGMYSAARVFAQHARVSGVSPQNCMELGMVGTRQQSQLLGGGVEGLNFKVIVCQVQRPAWGRQGEKQKWGGGYKMFRN